MPAGRMACPAALCPGRNQPFEDFPCNPAGLSPVRGWMQAIRSAAWNAFAVSCLCHAPALGDHLKPLLFSSKRTASSGFSSKYILSRLSSLQGSAYPPSNSQPACGFLCFLFFPVVCFPPCGKIILIAFHRFGVSSGGFLIHFLPGFLGGFGSIRPLLCQFCRRCRVGFGLPYQFFPCYLFPAPMGFQTFRFLWR